MPLSLQATKNQKQQQLPRRWQQRGSLRNQRTLIKSPMTSSIVIAAAALILSNGILIPSSSSSMLVGASTSSPHNYSNIYTATSSFNITLIDPPPPHNSSSSSSNSSSVSRLFTAAQLYHFENILSRYLNTLLSDKQEMLLTAGLHATSLFLSMAVTDQELMTLIPFNNNNDTTNTNNNDTEQRWEALTLSTSMSFVYARDMEVMNCDGILLGLMERDRVGLVKVLTEEGVLSLSSQDDAAAADATALINFGSGVHDDEGFVIWQQQETTKDETPTTTTMAITVDESSSTTNNETSVTLVTTHDPKHIVNDEITPGIPRESSPPPPPSSPQQQQQQLPTLSQSNKLTTTFENIKLTIQSAMNNTHFLQLSVYILGGLTAVLSLALIIISCKYHKAMKRSKSAAKSGSTIPSNIEMIHGGVGACPRINEDDDDDNNDDLEDIVITPERNMCKDDRERNDDENMTPMSMSIAASCTPNKTPVPLGIRAMRSLENIIVVTSPKARGYQKTPEDGKKRGGRSGESSRMMMMR